MLSIREEIKHNERILSRAGEVWGWDTPAGRLRAQRRAGLLIGSSAMASGKKVLELGCGTGIFSDFFQKTGAAVVVMDVSHNFLCQARQRNAGIVAVVCDAKSLPFASESFDAVVGSSVLHHLDLGPCLSEIYRVLKPAGAIAFAEPNMLNPQVALERSCAFTRRIFNATADETAFFKWQIAGALRSHNFRDVFVRPFGFLHPHTPAGCIRYLVSAENVLEKIPLFSEIAGSLLIGARKNNGSQRKDRI